MRGYSHAVRPAGAAIAAVLALSSTFSSAQEAPPAADPVVVPPPAQTTAPVPVAPSFAPSQPIVQQTPTVDERLAAAKAASEAEPAAPAAASSSRRTSAVAPEKRAASRPVKASRAAEPAAAPVAPSRRAAPAEPRAGAPIAVPAAAPAAVPSQPQRVAPSERTGPDPALLWAAGGGILLLAGLGGTAFVRRRKRPIEDRDQWAGAPVTEERVVAPAPILREQRPVAPALATASGGTLEAMVAAPPSAENPFRTHRKRLARARFLLAEQERQATARHAPAEPAMPPQTIHAEPRMQTVYRLGSGQGSRMGYKPQTR